MSITDKIFKEHDKAEDIANAVSDVIGRSCERCGEETSNRMVGDESYNYCKDCNWITNG